MLLPKKNIAVIDKFNQESVWGISWVTSAVFTKYIFWCDFDERHQLILRTVCNSKSIFCFCFKYKLHNTMFVQIVEVSIRHIYVKNKSTILQKGKRYLQSRFPDAIFIEATSCITLGSYRLLRYFSHLLQSRIHSVHAILTVFFGQLKNKICFVNTVIKFVTVKNEVYIIAYRHR